MCALRLAIGPSCGSAICRSVYRNRGCHFNNISLARSKACISSTGASLNYGLVAALVLAIRGSRGSAICSAVYSNRACVFNPGGLGSSCRKFAREFASGTNYSSVMALCLAILGQGARDIFSAVYGKRCCAFKSAALTQSNICCSFLGSSGNYSSVITLCLAITPSCDGAVHHAVYRNNSCPFTKGSYAGSNVCISSTGATLKYSSVVALVLAIGGSCGSAMDTAVYTSRACDFYNGRCGDAKFRAGGCEAGFNYSSVGALGLAMLPMCGIIAATAVYSKRDCNFEKR